jgi:hypothetical protein
MRKLIVLLAVMVVIMAVVIVNAQTRTVSWSPVTTYTDGSPIEAGNAVTYSIWRQDSVTLAIVQLANRISAISTTFDDSTLTKGRTYNFWAQAQLVTGASSDNSATYAWVNPTGKSSTPAGLVVN